METLNSQTFDLKDLEVKIEKYPMAESPNLLEIFLIVGYEETYFQEIILQNLQSVNINQEMEKIDSKMKKGSDNKFIYKEYKCRNLPTILGSITSNYEGGIFDGNQIIEKVFPIPPSIYYGFQETIPIDSTNVVFTNIQNNVVNIGYAFIFYENKIFNKLKIYIPKAFVIISQYPLFNIFNHLCLEVKKLYSNDQLQIPIEIQLYNIVNFVPAPINSSMKMTLIPSEELFEINRCKNNEEFYNLNNQEKYFLNQLSGYRCSDIIFSELFSVLSVETIVEVYLELISGKTIGFFSKHIEILNFTMYIFQQFFFPLAPNENVSGLSPLKYFCSDNVDQLIVGFVCVYEDLDNYNPFRELKPGEYRCLSEEDENKGLDYLLFKCDYILDLDKKILKEQDKYLRCDSEIEESKNNQRLNEYFRKVIGGSVNNNSFLDTSILRLLQKLKEISYKLTSYQHNNSSLPKFINSESNDSLNRAILDAFYQFNLNIAVMYYLRVSTYDGDYKILKQDQDTTIKSKEESGLNDDEYLFFFSFSNSLYGNVLGNFVGGYSEKEPTIYKTPKRIFEKLMCLKKLLNKEEYFHYILDIYDYVYNIKEQEDDKIQDKNQKKSDKSSKKSDKNDKNQKKNEIAINQDNIKFKKEDNEYKTTITFLEFYKYYFTKVASYFYYNANSEYVSGRVNKNNRLNIKYTYKYKKIELDQNLIYKYINLINKLDEESKRKYFKLTQDDIQTKQIITSNFISSSIEKYYINSKLIDSKELIRFSILGIVALTAFRHRLVHFTSQIYKIIGSLKFSIRKFVELILSISLRIFSKENNKNLYIYEKYFDIYKEGIEKRQIFPNDELIILEKKINEFTKSIQNTWREVDQEEYQILMNTKEKNRYTLDYDKKRANEIKAPSFCYGVNEIKVKINFKTKKIKRYYETSYSFIRIYNIITNILNDYYKDLDYSKINKEEYNKIIIYLIYFTTILNDDFPEDTNLFLFYCLDSFN